MNNLTFFKYSNAGMQLSNLIAPIARMNASKKADEYTTEYRYRVMRHPAPIPYPYGIRMKTDGRNKW